MGMDINAILEGDRHGDGKSWQNLGEIDIERGSDAFCKLREFGQTNKWRFTHDEPRYHGFVVNQHASIPFQFMDYLDVGFDFTYVTLKELSEIDYSLYVKCAQIANAHGFYGDGCRLCFYFNN